MKTMTEIISKIEKNISNGSYDYLVSQYDAEFSMVHVVDNENDMDFTLDGWHLWVVKNADKGSCNVMGCIFLQTVNNEYGFDHHMLTEDEIVKFIEFFTSDGYKINKIK